MQHKEADDELPWPILSR